MSKLEENKWLQNIKSFFDGDGEDFYYLLETMVEESKIDFCDLLYNASHGHGCTIHEGLMYSLDNDWDVPEEFNVVTFFIGEMESSTLSIDKYLSLLSIASSKYLEIFPAQKENVTNLLSLIRNRYSSAKPGLEVSQQTAINLKQTWEKHD